MDYILEDVFKDVRENDYDTFVKLEQIFQLNVFYPVHIEDDTYMLQLAYNDGLWHIL